MGRNSSRISRRIANSREGTNSTYFTSGQISDDEEQDADWSGEKRKKKMQPVRTNGNKKNGKSS
jgi:SAGA-associated factor 11